MLAIAGLAMMIPTLAYTAALTSAWLFLEILFTLIIRCKQQRWWGQYWCSALQREPTHKHAWVWKTLLPSSVGGPPEVEDAVNTETAGSRRYRRQLSPRIHMESASAGALSRKVAALSTSATQLVQRGPSRRHPAASDAQSLARFLEAEDGDS